MKLGIISLLTLGFTSLLLATATAQSIYFDDSSPNHLKLGNASFYEIGLRKANGSILYIIDKTTGQNLTLGSRYEQLWGAVFPGSAVNYVGGANYNPSGPNKFSYSWSEAEKILTLEYTPDRAATQKVAVAVTITASTEASFDLRMHVQNNWRGTLDRVLFPSDLVFRESEIEEALLTVYKSSLAAMALIHQGNRASAERIFDVFRKYYQTQGNNFRGFPQIWNPCTGLPDTNSDRWEGDNAFLLMALNYYSQVTGSLGNHNDLAQGLVSWLSQRANSCDQIFAEGVANMYAALTPFAHDSTTQQSPFRLRQCFFTKGQTSSVAYEYVLDHTIRGVLVFGDTTGFKYLNNFARSETWAFDHSTKITAYSAFAGEPFINLEITAQLLLTWKVWQSDLHRDLSHLRVELEKLRLSGKSDPRSSGLPYFVTDRGFDQAYSLPIIDSTCYLVFYYWGFNPFAPGKKYATYP